MCINYIIHIKQNVKGKVKNSCNDELEKILDKQSGRTPAPEKGDIEPRFTGGIGGHRASLYN
jgi:hypothetical protein